MKNNFSTLIPLSTLSLFWLICLLPVPGWGQTSNLPSRIISLDLDQFGRQLSAAPMERSTRARSAPLTMELPMPDGSERIFNIVESPILDPEFASRYPTFKTYMVQDINDPAISGRISVTPYGYNAVILTPEGMVHARPLDVNNPVIHQISQAKLGTDIIDCQVLESIIKTPQIAEVTNQGITNGLSKRTYRMAIVGTGEFHAANGGTLPAASAVVTASVNGIQAIFERELAVGFQLLLPFIYTNASTDPFMVGGNRVNMAASAIAANFNANDYDLGHVFHDVNQGTENLGGGGVAGLAVVCSNSPAGTGLRKGGGWSGSFDNTSPGWINLATHEFGHMFGMNHTFNGTGGFGDCTNNISTSTAYEIGSGSTIMSYSGTCQDAHNVPASGIADHYFHANSLEAAINFINGQTCEMATPTGNTPPTVNANPAGGTHTVPVGTPFRLTGSGSDANGDLVFYTWEQYNEDGDGVPTQGFIGATAAASTLAPLFRSYPPSTNPTRYFPNQNLIAANNYASSFEPLPTVARTLKFRLTARDWRPGGGAVNSSDLDVTISNSGPLAVTFPNGGDNLMSGNNANVTWNNNGSNAICNLVNIRLSIDGGLSFPYTLSTNTPNDGVESVLIPAGVITTNTAKIMVESACNNFVVFFDISNNNFNITSTCLAGISKVCPATPLNLPAGDGDLDLELRRYFGGNISQFNYNLNGSPLGRMINATVPSGTICNEAGNLRHSVSNFSVSTTGKYNFTINNNDAGFRMFSVYLGNYNSADPCPGFLGSNSWGNWSTQEGITLDLTACTEYSLVTFSTDENLIGSILASGEGEIYATGGGPGAGYAYTYAAVNTANNQVVATSPTSNFTALPGGTYQIYGVSYYTGVAPPALAIPVDWMGKTVGEILIDGTCVLFSNNFKPVTVVGICTAPGVNAPTITQPTCNALGSLTVNATGAGPFEYSINNGANFQTTTMFTGLAPGTYNIIVRVQGNANCSTIYAGNPVTLNAPTGCDNCAMVVSPDVPKNIVDNTTISSIINFPTAGTITDVNIKNVAGNHSYVGDLTFTLISPTNTSVVLLAAQCMNAANFNISFDDQAPAAISCPISDGLPKQPANPLSVFNGRNPIGNWTLQVSDAAAQDEGTLNSWTLEICGNFDCNPTFNSVAVVQPTCENQGGTITVNATGTGPLEYTIDGTTFQPSNVFSNVPPGNYGLAARLIGNQACAAGYGQNPVTITAPVGCAQCLTFVAPGVPQNITDNATISSIINFNRSGTITDVNIKNLTGTHTYVNDLTFTLTNPQGTSVVLFANQCASADNFNLTLDDASANVFACPVNDGSTKKPQNPLSVFNGLNPQGNWTLQVNDNAAADEGQLTGWTLEICGNFVNASCPPNLDINYASYVSSGVYQAENEITCVGTCITGSMIVLKAGNNIELKPNFEILEGSTLEMVIEGCGN